MMNLKTLRIGRLNDSFVWPLVEEPGKKRSLVLVIDDDPHVRRLISDLLSTHHEVMEAGNMEEIVSALAHHRPNLITLDVGLPDVDGMEILEWLHENVPQVPVVMISGDVSLEVAEEALNCQASAFITKPLNPIHLLLSVQDCLATSRSEPSARSFGGRLICKG